MTENNKYLKKIVKSNYIKLFLLFILILGLIIIFLKRNNIRVSKTNVKTSLEKIVEKSDLETVNYTYNVIAKMCKENTECDKTSNDIKDFQYVVSCKGVVTAGIDFQKVQIDVDRKHKTLYLDIPEAIIKDINVGNLKFLNGEDIPANKLPEARELCENTIKEKSDADPNLLPAAKEQAIVVLDNFYKTWIKSYDSSYKIEVK